MNRRFILSHNQNILLLRRQLEEAYEQGNWPILMELSRRMDEIQLRHWRVLGQSGELRVES